MKKKIEKLKIDASFELNKDDKIVRFMIEVNNGKGMVNNALMLITAMDIMENAMNIYLDGKSLPEKDRQDFLCTLAHFQDIKESISDLGICEECNNNYLLN